MVDINHEEQLLMVKQLMEAGDYAAADEALSSLLTAKVPEALFLSSTFSSSKEESDAEFERRSFNMLEESAKAKFAPAMYALAVCYDIGDLVDQNKMLAASWYRSATEAGHDRAKLHFGLALFSGVGVDRNQEAGLRLIQEAAESGLEDAMNVLKDLSQDP